MVFALRRRPPSDNSPAALTATGVLNFWFTLFIYYDMVIALLPNSKPVGQPLSRDTVGLPPLGVAVATFPH